MTRVRVAMLSPHTLFHKRKTKMKLNCKNPMHRDHMLRSYAKKKRQRENTQRKHRQKTQTENTDKKHREKTQRENTQTEKTHREKTQRENTRRENTQREHTEKTQRKRRKKTETEHTERKYYTALRVGAGNRAQDLLLPRLTPYPRGKFSATTIFKRL